jgi:hypothetical protein
VALQGTIDTFALPDVLRLLAATRKTGRLRLSGPRGTGSVWVEEGAVVDLDAAHAPHATEAHETLFELLRFEEGSFTFDVDVVCEDPRPAADVDALLDAAEAQLAEWREIEAVVPSLDAWVSLRHQLPAAEVTIDRERWATLAAVGSGATVRRIGDELCLAELAVSRAVKALVELGVVDILDTPPAGNDQRPLVASAAPEAEVASPPPPPPPDVRRRPCPSLSPPSPSPSCRRTSTPTTSPPSWPTSAPGPPRRCAPPRPPRPRTSGRPPSIGPRWLRPRRTTRSTEGCC